MLKRLSDAFADAAPTLSYLGVVLAYLLVFVAMITGLVECVANNR